MKKTWNWLHNSRHILFASVLVGLIVGLGVHFQTLSSYSAVPEVSYYSSQRQSKNSSNISNQEDYWKGTIDTTLKQMNEKIAELTVEVKTLNCGVTEMKISAAKEGGIYGLIASVIVALCSLGGQGLYRAIRKKS